MRIFLYKQVLELYMNALLTYPIVYIILAILVAAAGLLLGRQKYEERLIDEENAREDRSKQNIKTFKTEKPQHEDAGTKKEKHAAPNSTQEVIEGPVIIVDEEKVVEWKPPAEKKIGESTAEHEEGKKENHMQETSKSSLFEERTLSKDEWTDDDLEIFESRTYAFDSDDEEADCTISATEPLYTSRDRTAKRDPSDDEGVQVFDTNDFKGKDFKKGHAKAPAEPQKQWHPKYAFIDSVIEKEKFGNSQQGQQQDDDAVIYEKRQANKAKKNSSIQYIELDIEKDD
jgi:hypothetical protein